MLWAEDNIHEDHVIILREQHDLRCSVVQSTMVLNHGNWGHADSQLIYRLYVDCMCGQDYCEDLITRCNMMQNAANGGM
jgi:hypothetical protein